MIHGRFVDTAGKGQQVRSIKALLLFELALLVGPCLRGSFHWKGRGNVRSRKVSLSGPRSHSSATTSAVYYPEIALQEQVWLGVRLQNTKRSSYFTEIHVDFTAYRVHFTESVK